MTHIDYNIHAAAYASNRSANPDVLRALVATGQITGSSRLVDVGAGTGNHLNAITAATGCSGLGIEPAAGMRAQARVRHPHLDVRPGRAESLPLPDSSADLVYSTDVIHHVIDRPAHISEALRILAIGGLLCTVTDSRDDLRRRVPLTRYFSGTLAIEKRRYPDIEMLVEEMVAAGFSPIWKESVAYPSDSVDNAPCRTRDHSWLILLDDDAIAAGLARLE